MKKKVEDGKNKKAIMSGSKSTKLGIIDKYYDILYKLKMLDIEYKEYLDIDFQIKKQCLTEEYVAISKMVNSSFEPPVKKRTIPIKSQGVS